MRRPYRWQQLLFCVLAGGFVPRFFIFCSKIAVVAACTWRRYFCLFPPRCWAAILSILGLALVERDLLAARRRDLTKSNLWAKCEFFVCFCSSSSDLWKRTEFERLFHWGFTADRSFRERIRLRVGPDIDKADRCSFGVVSCSKVSKTNAISAKFVEVIKRCQKHVKVCLDNSQLRFCRQLEELGMVLKDLDESFTRSSGPGGQNVNKAENFSKALNSYELSWI